MDPMQKGPSDTILDIKATIYICYNIIGYKGASSGPLVLEYHRFISKHLFFKLRIV